MQQIELRRIMCAIVEGNHYDFHNIKLIDNESMSPVMPKMYCMP